MIPNDINQYIEENEIKINERFRHKFHAMPPIGWMNDPNGLCVFEGKLHLFYQYHPYDSKWGPMHWGHQVTENLLEWEHLPVALTPGNEYDLNGIFSGSAVIKDEKINLLYTGHTDKGDTIRQVQCIASSKDGVTFTKHINNPIIDERNIPDLIDMNNFRDPKIWSFNHKYIMAVGTKTKDKKGQFVFFSSLDLLNWTYLNTFCSKEDLGSMWECPDVFTMEGDYILMISPQFMRDPDGTIGNIHKTVIVTGTFDENLKFTEKTTQIIDYGFDFYAPQTVMLEDGRRIMMAWMNMWDRTYIPHELKHGWCGSMTLPRELRCENGHIYQAPINEIMGLRKNEINLTKLCKANNHRIAMDTVQLNHVIDMEMSFEFGASGLLNLSLFNRDYTLTLDKEQQSITIRRESAKYPIMSNGIADNVRTTKYDYSDDKTHNLRIIVDVSSIEVFVDYGRVTLTSLLFSDYTNDVSVSGHDIVVHQFSCWDLKFKD